MGGQGAFIFSMSDFIIVPRRRKYSILEVGEDGSQRMVATLGDERSAVMKLQALKRLSGQFYPCEWADPPWMAEHA